MAELEPISIQQLVRASGNANALDVFVNANASTMVFRPAAEPIETLEYWRNYMSALTKGADGAAATIESLTVATGAAGTAASVVTGGTPTARTFALTLPRGDKGVDGSFSQKAYTTEALMIADKANIPANTSVDVTNDATSTKNGTYAYNGTAFTKSAYDPVALAATDATTKANNAKTQAVADSKTYADTNKIDVSSLKKQYVSGNLVGALNAKRLGIGLNSSLSLVGGFDISAIPVNEGDVFYLINTAQVYTAVAGYGHVFYSSDLSAATDLNKISASEVSGTDIPSGIKYVKITAPKGAKIFAFNTRFQTTNHVWAIHKGAFSSSYDNGELEVTAIDNLNILIPKTYYPVQADGNIFKKDTDFLNNKFLTNVTPPVLTASGDGWRTAVTPIKSGFTYYVKVTAPSAYPLLFAVSEVESSAILGGSSAGTLAKASHFLVDSVNNIYEITLPVSITNPKSLLANIVINTKGYTLDITDTYGVYQGWVADNNDNIKAYDNLNGVMLIDVEARRQIVKNTGGIFKPDGSGYASYALRGKKAMLFGDSITWGTRGGYAQYFSGELGMTVDNYGISGHTVSGLRSVMLGRGGTYPVIDYSQADVVSIMIGTNNSGSTTTFWSSLDGLPAGNVYDHVAGGTTDAYFDSFPTTFAGSVGACIEYVKWKNPRCKIYLVSPPVNLSNSTLVINNVQYYERLADMHSVVCINATQDSGLAVKDISVWSYDNLHFNELGNEVFGQFLVKRIAST